MKTIRRWFITLVLKYYLDDFVSPKEDKELSDGQKASALTDVYKSEHLREFLSIRTENLIRRNLSASNMEESAFYRGQILVLRWLVKSAEDWHAEIKETR